MPSIPPRPAHLPKPSRREFLHLRRIYDFIQRNNLNVYVTHREEAVEFHLPPGKEMLDGGHWTFFHFRSWHESSRRILGTPIPSASDRAEKVLIELSSIGLCRCQSDPTRKRPCVLCMMTLKDQREAAKRERIAS